MKREINEFLSSRMTRSGLMASFGETASTTFSSDTGRFHDVYHRKVGYLDDGAYTYDLALAAMGLLLNGRREEGETILNVLEKDFYLPKNGIKGLYNSYRVSNGYTQDDLQIGGDGDRMHAGPLLWVAFAALNHAKLMRNTRYLDFTLDIVDWCRTELTYYRFPDGSPGGISMGMGWGPDWTKIFSTEHNVDYFAVLQMLRKMYDESPPEVRAIFHEKKFDRAWLSREMDHVKRFLMEVVFDWDNHIFRAGVNEQGVDPLRILDGTSWGLGGIGPANFAAWGVDLDRMIESALKFCGPTYTMENGVVIRGVDFTDPEGYDHQREPLVWFEGTGQFIIGLAELARYFAEQGDAARAKKYTAMAAAFTEDMNRFSSFYKLESALPYMAIRPPADTIVRTLKWEWEIPRGKTDEIWVKSMSSTMWYLYAVHDFYNTMAWD
ncbi:MAG: hypothetical protein BWY59_00937 [Verrucomicrobia bacterium ADurb.Bin345]|nr:MAG: hypothetical protein BWY59_00937 [Verrucomicrobia bacterium ADurb.Bin345]